MDGVVMHGPLFDGRADAVIARYCAAAEQSIGQRAEDEVLNRLGSVIRHSTGFYESHIHTERQSNDLVVTDTPVIYGPWLEGVGSRNQTTRFKGYHTFRTVSQKISGEAGMLVDAELRGGGYLGALNG